MEIIIALAVVAFFWYAAYKAWNGRGPDKPSPEYTVLVSHDYRTARYYQEQFGMSFDKKTHIATRPEQLQGWSTNAEFIYVNADNGKPDPDVVTMLEIYESQGATVEWVGFDKETNNEG